MATHNFEFVVSKVHKTEYKGGHSFVVTRRTIVLQGRDLAIYGLDPASPNGFNN
ncbi:hypothetical protein PHLCEN_2v3161 [Hermanssonia centrifuga]|uniref:Uncharacterized protein n=1 Tax=Hermanssonia centrifuga TaxID=98765 RepID=A0A2R6R125_9APHY|nr:hypothetical protein PHLCEN_2v3161 [Hermanssonia centrifuga]